MTIKTVLLCMLASLTSFSIQAKTYRCTDNNGKVSYGTSPCKEEQVERELKEFKQSTTLDPIQLEKDRVASESAQQRMESWQSYKDNKMKENCQARLMEEINSGKAYASTLRALSECANGRKSTGRSTSELESRENGLKAELSLKEQELRSKEMQHQNEIRRMENQQRLNAAFPPPWSR